MTEREKMLSGKLYNAGEEELSSARDRARQLCWRYNQMNPADWDRLTATLKELLGHLGEDSWVIPTFRCDYGSNISIGDHTFINHDCIFLDVANITIGARVLIAPRVCLYTAAHPIAPEGRDSGLEFAHPITIEDSVWLGGNAVVLPGVTIGTGTVVAAGSVVTRDLPPNVVAAGNPCRVLRPIGDADRTKWEAMRQEYEREKP